MADLQIKYSDGVVRVHSLDKKKILLGSSKKCDIRLTGDDVAAHHATVSMVGDRFRIDAEEGGKINLNGKPTSGALLRDRDAMRIGDCKLVFVAADAVEEKNPHVKTKSLRKRSPPAINPGRIPYPASQPVVVPRDCRWSAGPVWLWRILLRFQSAKAATIFTPKP